MVSDINDKYPREDKKKGDFRAENYVQVFQAVLNDDNETEDEDEETSGSETEIDFSILGEYEMLDEQMYEYDEEMEQVEEEVKELFPTFPMPAWRTELDNPDWDLVPPDDRKLLQLMMEITDVGYVFNPNDYAVKIDRDIRKKLTRLETRLVVNKLYDDAYENAFDIIDPVLMIRTIMTNLHKRFDDYLTIRTWERKAAKLNDEWRDYLTSLITTDIIQRVPSLQSVAYVKSQMKKWDSKPVKDILFCDCGNMFRKLWAKKPVTSEFVPYDIMSPLSVTDFHPMLARNLLERFPDGKKIYDVASVYNEYKKKYCQISTLILSTLKDSLLYQKDFTEPIFSKSQIKPSKYRKETVENSRKCCAKDVAVEGLRKLKPSKAQGKAYEQEFFLSNGIKAYHTLELVLKNVISSSKRLDKVKIPCSAVNYKFKVCQQTLRAAGDSVIYSSDNESEREYCEKYNVPYEIERQMRRCSYYYKKQKYIHPRTRAYHVMKRLRRSIRALTGQLTRRKPLRRYRDLLLKLCPKKVQAATDSLYSISNPSLTLHQISNNCLKRHVKRMRVDWIHHRCQTTKHNVYSIDYAHSDEFYIPEQIENLSEMSENVSYARKRRSSEFYNSSDTLTGDYSSSSYLDLDPVVPTEKYTELKFIKRPPLQYIPPESPETRSKSCLNLQRNVRSH